MSKEVSQHVDHEKHRANEIQGRGDHGVPKALRIRLLWSDGRYIDIHAYGDSNKLQSDVKLVLT